MAKLTSIHVLLVTTTLLALAGCSKDESTPEPEYGESTAAGPGASAGGETTTSVEYDAPKEEQPAGEAAAAKSAEMPEAERKMQALSDGQIVKLTSVVDSGEIDQAKLAKERASDARVKQFAAMMIKQHTQSKQKGDKLAKQASITPEESPVATELANGSSSMMQTLRDAEGREFDALYIDGQVSQHAKVLGLLENQLIPSAANEQLKGALVEARTMVSNHLTEAKDIQQKLSATAE